MPYVELTLYLVFLLVLYNFGFTVYSSMQTDRRFLRKFSDNDMETN